MSQRCRQCSGTGMVQTAFGPKPCPGCGGSGLTSETEDSDQKSNAWSAGDWIAVIIVIIAVLFILS